MDDTVHICTSTHTSCSARFCPRITAQRERCTKVLFSCAIVVVFTDWILMKIKKNLGKKINYALHVYILIYIICMYCSAISSFYEMIFECTLYVICIFNLQKVYYLFILLPSSYSSFDCICNVCPLAM